MECIDNEYYSKSLNRCLKKNCDEGVPEVVDELTAEIRVNDFSLNNQGTLDVETRVNAKRNAGGGGVVWTSMTWSEKWTEITRDRGKKWNDKTIFH